MAGRQSIWTDTILDVDIPTSSFNLASLMGNLIPTDTRGGFTLIRTLICLDIAPLIPGVVSGIQQVSIGIGVASQEAFAAFIVPDADTPADYPARGWVYRCVRGLWDSSEVGVGTQAILLKEDIRTKRKVDDGEAWMEIRSSSVQGVTFTVHVSGIVRCLFLM